MSDFKLLDYLSDNKIYNNFYEVFHFFINVNFDLNTIKNDDTNSSELYCKFLHEFTHYLQGVCTVFGINNLHKYFEFQIDLFISMAHKIKNKEMYSSNTFTQFISKYKTIKYNYNYDFSSNKLRSENDILFTYEVENPILEKKQYEHFIKLDNEYCLHISPKCLRETMAMMTYFNFMKMTKQDAIDYLLDKKILPIYSYLYLYFSKKYKKINDLTDFLYYFSELCLQTNNPTEYITFILNDLIEYYDRYEDAASFFDFIINKHKEIHLRINKLKEIIEIQIIKLNEIGKKGNEYFQFIASYMDFFKNGLNYILNHGTIFKKNMDRNYINYFVKYCSSPIIIQKIKEKEKKIYCLDTDKKTQNKLIIIFALSIILEKYITTGEEFDKCPFLQDIDICPRELKKNTDIKICLREPYLIKSLENGDCPFYNANKLLGYLDDEELKKCL